MPEVKDYKRIYMLLAGTCRTAQVAMYQSAEADPERAAWFMGEASYWGRRAEFWIGLNEVS